MLDIEKAYHVMKNIKFETQPTKENLNKIEYFVAGLKHELGSQGRIILRLSGTEPVLRVMVESFDKQQAIEYSQKLIRKINNIIG